MRSQALMGATGSQQSAEAEVPAEHEVPDELTLAAEFDAFTRDEWRELVTGVLRKAGRETLPDTVEDALRVPVATGVTVAPLYTAEDADDLPAVAGVPGVPPFVRGGCVGAHPESGVPGGGTFGSGTRTPTWRRRRTRSLPTWRRVSSLWLLLGEGAIPVDSLGDVHSDVLLDPAPATVEGGHPAAEAFLSLIEGRADLAPGGSLGLDPLSPYDGSRGGGGRPARQADPGR